MADETKIKSKSLQKAMMKFNVVEEYYAKMIVQFSNKTRLKLYRKIASLMRNRFSFPRPSGSPATRT